MPIAFPIVFGQPLALWLGVLTAILLFTTAALGWMAMHGKTKFKNHLWLACATLVMVVIHAVVVLFTYVF